MLSTAITTIYAQDIQQPVGMTIFNSDNFYAADNTITVQNGFTTVLDNTNSEILTTSNSTPKEKELVVNKRLNKLKTTRKQLHLVVAKPQKSEEKYTNPTVISWGNSPYGNNSLYIGTNNSFAVVPTTTTNNQKTNTHPVCHFDKGEIPLAKALQVIFQKQSISSHDIVFISNYYSKTSRIRPPPTPTTTEGGIAVC